MRAESSITGLSSEEVSNRLSQGLSNRQDTGLSRSFLNILQTNFLTLFNAVVGGSFLILLVLGYWQDALFGIAVIANLTIGVVQEYRSKRVLDKLTILSKAPIRVLRNGESGTVRVEQVVLNDVIELRAGDQLPADAKVLFAKGLEVDESQLTGEAEPVPKGVGMELLSGSGIAGGEALVEVIRVGADTYSTKLMGNAKRFTKVASEIRRSLDKVVLWISWALLPIVLVVVLGQLQASDNWEDAAVRSIASVISLVPQGLVLITSIAFAIAATRLARKKVLLQELAAVEGLARVDVVCIDKTGTLTAGEMQFDSVTELTPLTSGQITPGSAWREILGEFANRPAANSTTRALVDEFPAAGLSIEDEVLFDSERKFSAIDVNGERWSLGAPEFLTKDPETLAKVAELASRGLRPLLLCVGANDPTPLVLVSLKETVRSEAALTLEYLQSQGVSVRVLSGDHPQTVAGVARAVGLEFDGEGFDARELPTDLAELGRSLDQHRIFGRVTPEQKKLIVQALQLQGRTVAMIGDGINDALSLKQADLGIAMGSGAPATRAIANLVLIDNQFEVLPEVLGEGRRVIANTERLSRLFLTKTVWAMLLALMFSLMAWEFPFLPRQISAVDGFTIGVPAFLLALLPNAQRYQPGFLKRSLLFSIPTGAVTALAVIILAWVIRQDGTWSGSEAQTATAVLLSITGFWVLGSLVRPWSKVKLSIMLLMVFGGAGVFWIPLSAEFFGFSCLSGAQLVVPLLIGLAAATVIELVHFLWKRRHRATE